MKKTLVALAALASIGSAFADAPTIVPYARLDIGLQSITDDSAGKGKDTGGLVGADSVYNTSLWGIKGETDLGSGMKGFAQVEQKFSANSSAGLSGTVDSTTGDVKGSARVGKIGLSGGFGTIAIGSQWGPYDNITIGDAQNYNGFSPYGKQLNAGAHGDNGNGAVNGQTSASIQYTSPSYGGLVFEVNYAPKKATKTTNNDTDVSSWGADVQYTAGPLAVAAAVDHTLSSDSNVGAALVNTTDYSNAWLINGSYNLGVVSVFAAFNGATTSTIAGSDKDTGWSLGVSYPVGQWTLSASVAGLKTSGDDAAFNYKTDSYGAQGLYAFNKQFTGYVGFISTKTTPDVGSSTTINKFGTGLTMSF